MLPEDGARFGEVEKENHMKKALLVLALLVLVLALVACGGDKDIESSNGEGNVKPELTVGFIYIGSVNDGGYTQAHHTGTLAMVEEFGGKVEAVWEEEVEESTQAVQSAALGMIDKGAKVIIGTSFGFGEPLLEMANDPAYSDIIFLHFSGDGAGTQPLDAPNFGYYFGAMEQARYLTGIVAGKMTKSNKLGYVAAHPYTEVQIGINAFTLGAQSVNPDIEVNVVYINSWYDPPQEKAAAEALLEQGCDVLAQHCDTTGPQLAAAAVGAYAIGYNWDNSALEGLEDAYLTGPIWHHEIFLIPTMRAIIDGTWAPESYYGTLADGYIDISPMTANVPEDVQAVVNSARDEIAGGTRAIFAGPIKDSEGEERVPAGVTLDRAGIWAEDGPNGFGVLIMGAK